MRPLLYLFSTSLPVGLRPLNVVVEQQVLVVVLFGKQVDDVGLKLVFNLDMQPRRASGIQSLKELHAQHRVPKRFWPRASSEIWPPARSVILLIFCIPLEHSPSSPFY